MPPKAVPVTELEERIRFSVGVTGPANERVTRLANKTGLTKLQIVEWAIMRQSERSMLAELKAAELSPARRGRRKTSIFS